MEGTCLSPPNNCSTPSPSPGQNFTLPICSNITKMYYLMCKTSRKCAKKCEMLQNQKNLRCNRPRCNLPKTCQNTAYYVANPILAIVSPAFQHTHHLPVFLHSANLKICYFSWILKMFRHQGAFTGFLISLLLTCFYQLRPTQGLLISKLQFCALGNYFLVSVQRVWRKTGAYCSNEEFP